MTSDSDRIYYDPDKKVIVGPGFTVKHHHQRGRDDDYPDIFIYEDEFVRFGFIAQRDRWNEKLQYWEDSQCYDVRRIGFPVDGARTLEEDIPKERKAIALANIKRALYFDQSAYYSKPVIAVVISVRQ